MKSTPTVFKEGTIKFWVTDHKITCEAIGFKMANEIELSAGDNVDLVYTPTVERWQGVRTIRLQLKDIRHSSFSKGSRKEREGKNHKSQITNYKQITNSKLQ